MEALCRVQTHAAMGLAVYRPENSGSSCSSSTAAVYEYCSLGGRKKNGSCSSSARRSSIYGQNILQAVAGSKRSTSWRGGRVQEVQCAIQSVTEADFEAEVLKSSVPVMADFWASWCGPCRLVVPVIEGIQKEYGDKLKVVKIETDPNKTLVEKYKVYGLPTIILFENGEVVPGGHIEGAITKVKLQTLLKEKLPALVES